MHGGVPCHNSSAHDGATAEWKGSFSGFLRDPALPPLPAPTPRHHLSAFSRHIHGPRTYAFGAVKSSSYNPTPTVPEGDEAGGAEGDVRVEERALSPDKTTGQGREVKEGIPTASTPMNVGQQTAPPIPPVAWPLPTPCKHP